MKRVHFSADPPQRHSYKVEGFDSESQNFQEVYRESLRRNYIETRLLSDPHSELGRLQNLFESVLNFDVTLVFGNLGRHPHLLNYYLDFCFAEKYSIGVLYKSFAVPDCPYRVTKPLPSTLDFLFIVEPEFGYTVSKPPGVGHVVVLSSHLSLISPGHREQVQLLHLGTKILRESMLPVKETWKPPVFNAGETIHSTLERLKLDVSFCKSAHEAYMRLLTGRQILQYRQLPVIISPQMEPVLQSCIDQSRKNVEKYFSEKWIEQWYFDVLQTTEPNPFDFILKRNPLKLSETSQFFVRRK